MGVGERLGLGVSVAVGVAVGRRDPGESDAVGVAVAVPVRETVTVRVARADAVQLKDGREPDAEGEGERLRVPLWDGVAECGGVRLRLEVWEHVDIVREALWLGIALVVSEGLQDAEALEGETVRGVREGDGVGVPVPVQVPEHDADADVERVGSGVRVGVGGEGLVEGDVVREPVRVLVLVGRSEREPVGVWEPVREEERVAVGAEGDQVPLGLVVRVGTALSVRLVVGVEGVAVGVVVTEPTVCVWEGVPVMVRLGVEVRV